MENFEKRLVNAINKVMNEDNDVVEMSTSEYANKADKASQEPSAGTVRSPKKEWFGNKPSGKSAEKLEKTKSKIKGGLAESAKKVHVENKDMDDSDGGFKLTLKSAVASHKDSSFIYANVVGEIDGKTVTGVIGCEIDGRDADVNLKFEDGTVIDDPFMIDWEHFWSDENSGNMLEEALRDA